MQGHKDYPLSDLGINQAEELANKMKNDGFICNAVYSSDLLRAKQTAETITKILGLEVTKFDERLREMHLGIRQGKKVDEITIEEKELADKIWKNHDIHFPGGGESVNEMKSRVKAAFDEIVEIHSEEDTVLIIAHGGTLYHVLYHILGVYPETDDWFSNCSYNVLLRENNSEPWKLTIFNGNKL